MAKNNTIRTQFVAALLCAALHATALAQDAYPSRPIRMVVGLQAGGVTDVVARRVAAELSSTLGQSVVVDNVAGAGGTIATSQVARAQPDGYTLQLGTTSSNVLAPMIQANATQGKIGEVTPVAVIGIAPLALFAHPGSGVATAADLVARVRRDAGKLSYGSAGIGSTSHLAGELFKLAQGRLDVLHVPYRGGPAMDQAVVSGEVAYGFDAPGSIAELEKAGRVKILAVMADRRSDLLPDTPTAREAGLGDVMAGVSYYIFVPARTPPAVLAAVHAALAAAYAKPAFQQDLARNGVQARKPDGPAAASAYLQQERERWENVIARQQVKLE